MTKPIKRYAIVMVPNDPSFGYQAEGGLYPYMEFDEITDPPTVSLYFYERGAAHAGTPVILDGDHHLDEMALTTLRLGSGAGIPVTAIAAQLNKCAAIPTYGYPLTVEEWLFTESSGAGSYSVTIPIPAGATVLDVRFMNDALWTNGTSAVLNVGDGDDADGYLDGVDVLAAPIANIAGAGGISSFLKDTGAGAYAGLTKHYAAAGAITATIVTGTGTEHTGISRLIVVYVEPAEINYAIKT